ncbi:MAG TPA: Asp23/Gls24 family envelope stress response protein [Sandaracinaceae bacterium LLY-WYZ-13_1]|nr:Asp23/Gls24 family envelope stress response protein [Sandaracinaceae bacterium LLY-WYZ-13_1]
MNETTATESSTTPQKSTKAGASRPEDNGTTRGRPLAPRPVAPDAEPRRRGRTYIDDEVVSVIARIAAEQVEGVHQLGRSTLRGMMARLGRTGGVDAEIGLKEAAVDLEIVVEFGHPIREVADELRETVIETIEATTGRRVIEVNVYVVDVHLPRLEHTGRTRRVE